MHTLAENCAAKGKGSDEGELHAGLCVGEVGVVDRWIGGVKELTPGRKCEGSAPRVSGATRRRERERGLTKVSLHLKGNRRGSVEGERKGEAERVEGSRRVEGGRERRSRKT